MPNTFAFPTLIHRQASEKIVEHFSRLPQVHAILLVNSCARGVATPESDLDIAVLIDTTISRENQILLEKDWHELYMTQPVFTQIKQLGQFSGVHLDFFNGQWTPEKWDDGGGPDYFEIEIGNRVAYSVPLWDNSNIYKDIRSSWLPYYDESLQQERLAMVRASCQLNIARLQFYVNRGLYFQAFDRLYHAFQEFLQAVFIARSTYPIAYNKWIHEQVVNWLKLPLLYTELPSILEVSHLEGDVLNQKGKRLLELLEQWTSLQK